MRKCYCAIPHYQHFPECNYPFKPGRYVFKMNKWKKRFSRPAQQFRVPPEVASRVLRFCAASFAGDIFLCKFSFSVVSINRKCIHIYVPYAMSARLHRSAWYGKKNNIFLPSRLSAKKRRRKGRKKENISMERNIISEENADVMWFVQYHDEPPNVE